jgi:hypothetical protein
MFGLSTFPTAPQIPFTATAFHKTCSNPYIYFDNM